MPQLKSTVPLGILSLCLIVIGCFGLIFFPEPGVICLVAGICLAIWTAGNEQVQQSPTPRKDRKW